MDSGWAVVIGAVVAFAGTIAGPIFLDGRKRRAERETARRDELAQLIPELIELLWKPPAEAIALGEAGKLMRLSVLLNSDEAPIARIFVGAASPPNRSNVPAQGAIAEVIPDWFRGSITPRQAAERYASVATAPVTLDALLNAEA